MSSEPSAQIAAWDYLMVFSLDKYTDIAAGKLALTAVSLVGSKVQLLQAGAYQQVRIKTA